MLRRAVDTLRRVPGLQCLAGRLIVTVVGERVELEGADRMIVDRYPGCGPLGGMEAALRDLEGSEDAEWAFFMPVDMPFVSPVLIDWLLQEWGMAAAAGARICHVVVDERPLPLLCLVHRSVYPYMVEALTAGQFKVTRVLQAAGESMALLGNNQLASCLHTTEAGPGTCGFADEGWTATGEQERFRHLRFANLNTKEDFAEAETFIEAVG